MLNPQDEFEKDKTQFKSNLNFKYIWKYRTDNRLARDDSFNKYHDKLGHYIDIYNSEFPLEDIYIKIYPIYEKILKILSKFNINETKMKYSLVNKFITDGDNFILSKDNYIYKGTKYFYKPEEEKQLLKDVPFGYYGDKYIAYFYARRYCGGLQVYKLNRDIKLFNVTNDKNIKLILKMIIKQFNLGKSDEIFFDNTTYRELYKAIKVKYGVEINKYYQAYNIAKYTNFDDIWLYYPDQKNYFLNSSDKSYTGWYYGAGKIDRICAKGIMLLIKDKFDGLTGKGGFYSPYLSSTSTELILWNQDEILKRRPNHKYDTMQFVKKLSFNPFEINFNTIYANNNKNFKMIKFYLNHKLDLSKINISSNKNNVRIMSLNVHNFNSINLNDTKSFILLKILNICDHLSIDICCLQEYFDHNFKIESSKYSYIKSNKHYGLVILYKKDLPIKNINHFLLPNEVFLRQMRFGLMFELYDKKYIITHLEIGKRFYDRSSSMVYAKELYEIIMFNSKLRIKQLNEILKYDPDYIIGDFNFTPLDEEYTYLTKTKNYHTKLVDYTTPHNTQVDFVFSKTDIKLISRLNFQYSDHLPIVAVVDS